jgi:thymidine phosphorylase
MLPQEIIRKKRDGQVLPANDINEFIQGLVDGRVTDAQAAAFAMAVFFKGMNMDERVALTSAMMRSGNVLDWRDLGGPVLDKHSTGGIGDSVSLMFAPMLAACGAYVPMISGRGLGHTGGTLDKFDSIPGYKTAPGIDLFRATVRDAGCAIIGQTEDLAPADRKLYAIRDVTATVESISLITASILSKKLAAGLHGLVMDVKTGSGAFMPVLKDSRELAESLAFVATGAGLPTTALITDMDEPLANAAGNAVEIQYAVDYLKGAYRVSRLHEVNMALCVEALLLGKLAVTADEARKKLEATLTSGKATEHFAKMVSCLGGPSDFVEKADTYLPKAPIIRAVVAAHTGYVEAIATRDMGLAIVALGGGRTRAADPIDHAVGVTDILPTGTAVKAGDPLCVIHARDEAGFAAARDAIVKAIRIADSPPAKRPLVYERIAGEGVRGS